MLSGDAFNTEEFWTIAGPCWRRHDLHLSLPIHAPNPNAAAVVEEFKKENYDPEGYTLYTYAAVQAYVQAAAATKGTDSKANLRVAAPGQTPSRP